MLDALAQLFSLVVQPCYDLTGSWWMAILLFTVIIKIVLMPLSLWCQWNSIVMVRLMPDLNRAKVKYFGDTETIGEKQNELNKKYHYHPLLSLIPLAAQILILFGLVEVIHGITDGGAPGTEFLGLIPVEDGGLSWVMPLLAALSAVVMGVAQNHINPLQREQSRAEKNSTNGLSILLSLVLGIYVAAGMAFYWVCSNLMSIAVQALCNLLIRPERHVDYDDLHASQAALAELNALSPRRGPWWRPDPLARREKADYKRFFETVDKHLVVYSESSGFYKYFQGALEWLLANSDVRIHYITGDPNDQIFGIAEENPRIFPYYIGEKRLITLMMKLDADVVLTTLEDLDNFYLKRSYVRKDTKYVFTFHHMTSTHLTALEKSYDNHDSLLCVGPHQVREIRRAEELRNLRPKELVECGYDLLDREIAEYAQRARPKSKRPIVLLAPSWQDDCILDSCADEVIRPLLGHGYHVIVRPHPEYVKRYRARWESLVARYSSHTDEELTFEQDFSTSDSIFDADVLITDWSSIFCEFSFTTLKPCICINTPMKVGNPNWERLGIEPTDITLRDEVGVSLDPKRLDQLPQMVEDMLKDPRKWNERIMRARSKTVFNPGRGAEIAGHYLLDSILSQQTKREGASIHEAR
ncbi:YidC/Oxa1 family membrane protein insertase [Thermophilibacter immobilis]|jgi:YidC/Oxa1 family membrane protein insertase|uniref:Membrane protein insertase YidC n=1 Tax=Thermophilibacter immobilis TaxID=2779519 RepID=A0A7S7MA23_9ACTN|nr:YidC/Oxa1 family membrane protein insertase [Thermophilibacter immobilis]QOY61378.1 YidC/Oxa1 family membrane protein insertase [Thermophilibacter immobilis]